MVLIGAIETEFDIMMDTDDVIDMSSFGKAKEILSKYEINAWFNGQDSIYHWLNQRHQLKDQFQCQASGHHFDASDFEAVKQTYNAIFKAHKRLDILVNNAGIMNDALIGMIRQDDVEITLKVNVASMIYNLQFGARLMMRNKSGSIINTSSIIGLEGSAGQSVYSSSKAAVVGLTYSASKELGPQGIRVNCIAPGYIQTDMTKNFSEEKQTELINKISIKRAGTPLDVAHTVLFLSSEMSNYITGQVIGIDGGMSL